MTATRGTNRVEVTLIVLAALAIHALALILQVVDPRFDLDTAELTAVTTATVAIFLLVVRLLLRKEKPAKLKKEEEEDGFYSRVEPTANLSGAILFLAILAGAIILTVPLVLSITYIKDNPEAALRVFPLASASVGLVIGLVVAYVGNDPQGEKVTFQAALRIVATWVGIFAAFGAGVGALIV